MKKIYALLLVFIALNTVVTKAQYVDIADYSLISEIKYAYPDCFNSLDQMDTICISTKDSLSFSNLGDENKTAFLNTLRYFKGLKYLNINYMRLTDMPTLSATITEIACSYTQNLNTITSLPLHLQKFTCSGPMKLAFDQSFFSTMPSSLKYLDISGPSPYNISSITINALPPALEYFNCGIMKL